MVKKKRVVKVNKEERNKKILQVCLISILFISMISYSLVFFLQNNENPNNIPQNLPFQKFTDPNSGVEFYGTIVNGNQFIYENISMFENKTHIQNVADRVKNLSYVEISYEENINDSSVFFVINRVLTSIEKDFSLAKINSTCKENTLFISLNQTKEGCLNLNLENNIKENLQTFEYFLVI